MYSHFKEVITLKFGDVITAVASLTIILILFFPLGLVLTAALGNAGFELGAFVSAFLSTIIVGYIYAQKIWEENRTKTIAQIAVLFTVLIMFMGTMESAATADWTPKIKEEYMKANPAATPSVSDWYYIEKFFLTLQNFLVVILVLAITFIGLYIGSTLKKPARS